VVPKNDQNEEQLEADCRHDQEVHGGDACRMVVEKGLPRLQPRSPALRHVLGDHRLSDLNAKLEQFAVNARRTSQRIGQAHLSYQAADLAWYSLNFTAGIAGVEPAAEADDGLVDALVGDIDAHDQRRRWVLDQRRLVPGLGRTVGVRIVEG